MKRTKCGNKKGFTIIETSLVLAIAGLILVMVFIALPALQRQQRDTKRKDDAMHFMQALKNYQSNNRGAMPSKASDAVSPSQVYKNGYIDNAYWGSVEESDINDNSWGKFYIDYLGENFLSPSGNNYGFTISKCVEKDSSDVCSEGTYGYGKDELRKQFENGNNDWFIYMPATCEGGKPTLSNNQRNVAMVVMLEGGGDYCVNN